jgi:DNA invertase Pin-like site-specific DNA recombinase
MNSTGLLRNYIYIRTSTAEQSPDLQLRDISTLIQLENCVIIAEQESAWKANSKRSEFEKLCALIKTNKIDNLYIFSIDRLHRNFKRLKEFLLLCKTYNVKIISYCQNWISSVHSFPPPFNEIMTDFMIQIIGWMAETESTQKSARVKLAVRKLDNVTVSHKGKKWGRKSISNSAKEKVIQFRNEGKSIRQICELVIIYDKNNNAKKIAKSTVHKLLTTKV